MGHSSTLAQVSGILSGLGLARLTLRFDLLDVVPGDDNRGGDLVVTVLVDDRNVFARPAVEQGRSSPESVWHVTDMIGFAPAQMLGEQSPLMPAAKPRRVALARCGCGYPECQATTALIAGDNAVISWSDFVHFSEKAVFYSPTDAEETAASSGSPLALTPLIFDAEAYRTEIARATQAWLPQTG